MECAKIITSPSTGLSGILFSVRTQYSWRTRIWKNINTIKAIILLNTRVGCLLKWATTRENLFSGFANNIDADPLIFLKDQNMKKYQHYQSNHLAEYESWLLTKMGHDARKSVFGVRQQHRRRPACASTQSDQRLRYSLFEKCRT